MKLSKLCALGSWVALTLGFGVMAQKAQTSATLFEADFQLAEPGKVPEGFMVIDGGFAVKADGPNKFLELPGAPLDTFGTLFGPTEKDGLAVSARVFGTGKGRRFPAFAIGLNGVAGYKLQVTPSKKAVELFKGETLKASVTFEWKSGVWTHLKLQIRKTKPDAWTIEGKVWAEGSTEPSAWTITSEDKEEPSPGRASVWGSPYATTPIHFDDLKVTKP